jgi:TolB protein
MDPFAVYAWFPDGPGPNGEVRQLSPPIGHYWQGCIHPDGTHAVYWGGGIGTAGVWRTNLDNFRTERLTSMASTSWHPSYGVAGDRIVFASDRYGRDLADDIDVAIERMSSERGVFHIGGPESHIFIANEDGTLWRALTSGPYHDERPALSPDNSRAVFVSDRGEPRGLWTVATDEEAVEDPTPLAPGTQAYRPWWSVDGETIYFFTSIDRRNQRLCSVPASGGEVTTLPADDRGRSRGPYLDPDGEHLLTHSDRDGDWKLWEFPLDGGEPRLMQPPGFAMATHPSRARNGVVVFDAPSP